MFDILLRPFNDRILSPLVILFTRFFSPNALTFIAFLFALASVGFIFMSRIWAGLVFWLLNRIFDGLDGAVARYQNRQSDFGGYLDIMLDFITYAMLPLVFTFRYGQGESTWMALSVMLGLFYINSASWIYLSSLLEKNSNGSSVRKEQTSVSMPSGLVEGMETIAVYTLFFFIPGKLNLLFYIMSVALVLGILMRMIWAKKKFERR